MFTNGVEDRYDRNTEETRMRRSAPLVATLTAVLAVTAAAAALPGAAQAAGGDPGAYTSHGEVLNILPPGWVGRPRGLTATRRWRRPATESRRRRPRSGTTSRRRPRPRAAWRHRRTPYLVVVETSLLPPWVPLDSANGPLSGHPCAMGRWS